MNLADLGALGNAFVPKAPALEGRFCSFVERGYSLGHSTYTVFSRRGGFPIAWIEWRNQWNTWSVKFDPEAPVNREILAEIYAFLKSPKVVERRSPWRAAVRDWLIKWL